MKTQLSFRIIFAGVLLALLNACATYSRSGSAALVGAWRNSLETVWTIKTGGTFDVDLTHDGKRDLWGNYTVSGDTITIQETGGKSPKGCHGPGVYKFSRTGENTLTFMLVSDACKERKKNVLLAWHRK